MFRLAGLITAELAGERRFYSEKGAETRFLSAPVCLSIKKSGEDDGSGFVGNRADFIICFYITCGFDF